MSWHQAVIGVFERANQVQLFECRVTLAWVLVLAPGALLWALYKRLSK